MKILSLLFKTGLGILAALIVMEISLHVIASTQAGKVFPVIEPQLGQPDKDIGFALSPHKKALWPRENRAFISTNSDGLRDREYTKEKDAGVFRVALSGDSVAEALQVENHFVFEHLAESKFRYGGKDVEIINFAMSGNGPLRQLVRLEKFAPALQPDMIVMLMSAGDFLTKELLDDSANPAYQIKEGGAIARSYGFRTRLSQRYADKPIGKAFMFLIHNSNLFRLFWQKRDRAFLDILGLNIAAPKPARTKPDQCKSSEIQPLYDFWVERTWPENWQVTQHYFKEIAAFAQGKPVVIGFYLPLIEDQNCQQEIQKRDAIISVIQDITSANGLVFVDWNHKASTHMDNGSSINSLRGFGISYGTGHLNYTGHEIYADVLYQAIMSYTNN